MKKRIAVLLMMLTMMTFLPACDSSDEADYAPTTNEEEMTDVDFESVAANALYEAIVDRYPDVEAGNSRYSIGSIEEGWVPEELARINGTVTLYDKYGEVYGDFNRKFTVTVYKDGDTACSIR